jgi:lysozyme
MRVSKAGIDLIKKFEGFKSRPYLCPAKIPTIGWGNTTYPNGQKVKLSDPPINESVANDLLINILDKFEKGVVKLVKSKINQNQFDALVSFAFNVGLGNFGKSTLLKKVNINPVDPTIRSEFARWNKSGGKVLTGLTRRREAESNLYYKTS